MAMVMGSIWILLGGCRTAIDNVARSADEPAAPNRRFRREATIPSKKLLHQCQSHFQMSASQPSSNVRFWGADFVFHGLQFTQCRRSGHERTGHLRLFL